MNLYLSKQNSLSGILPLGNDCAAGMLRKTTVQWWWSAGFFANVREFSLSRGAFGAAPGGEPLAHRSSLLNYKRLCLAYTRGIASYLLLSFAVSQRLTAMCGAEGAKQSSYDTSCTSLKWARWCRL